uniref:Putative ovule protein n=1 Tax=Solanum chacoense TaxID=4108 RepID=A0A0V0GWK4_SOLCH
MELGFGGQKCCGSLVLMDEFSVLYRVSCQRELSVPQVRGTQGGGTFWDLRFRRNFQDWQVTALEIARFTPKPM